MLTRRLKWAVVEAIEKVNALKVKVPARGQPTQFIYQLAPNVGRLMKVLLCEKVGR